MRYIIMILWVLALSPVLQSQCLIGSIGISGAGCGCLSGCDLTPWGGPDCNPPVTGNCTSQYMSTIIDLNDECEVRLEARMSNRPGCNASGADSGDRMRVREVGGPITPWNTGASNATLYDEIIQQGGQILVEGNANRADEIITYELYFESGSCPFCILLPVELTTFNAFLDGYVLDLDWITATEHNNQGFFIEASRDNKDFEMLHFESGQGSSLTSHHYKAQVALPSDGGWYVRLVQQDYNGTRKYAPVVFFEVESDNIIDFRPSPGGVQILNRTSSDLNAIVEVFSPDGRMQYSKEIKLAGGSLADIPLQSGLSLVNVRTNGDRRYTEKIFR